MNLNKISCQKYVFEQNEYNSSPILELSVKFASQICHENINKPLNGTYLANFGIDIVLINIHPTPNLRLRSAMKNTNTPLDGAYLADFGIDIT